jgi:hypothetical protein
LVIKRLLVPWRVFGINGVLYVVKIFKNGWCRLLCLFLAGGFDRFSFVVNWMVFWIDIENWRLK